MDGVKTGIDMIARFPSENLNGKRLGLLCNPASVNKDLVHSRDVIQKRFPKSLVALFSPQHGFYAEKQDNMIESGHFTDPDSNIPVFSLYGETRFPTKKMFDLIDVLMVDLQDAGTRVYTFIYTMSYCMEAAKKYNKKVIILDRPNPVGGKIIEGNCLNTAFYSFVGRYQIPMRHGLTIGELALLFNDHFNINCDLDIIKMDGWQRSMLFPDTGLAWVAPSPNLPTFNSAMVYPGQVIWEGTNVSEGRGTTQPFEFFGAPFLNPEHLLADVETSYLRGAHLRKIEFEPTANKWKGIPCKGFQIHVTDHDRFRPYMASLALLKTVLTLYKNRFEYKKPPYEYEYNQLPIDLILGDSSIRKMLEQNTAISEIEAGWQPGLDAYVKTAAHYHLY